MHFALIGNIGTWEIMLILFVALIVFGPGKLPEVAKTIGKTLGEIKKVTSGVQKEFQDAINLETDSSDKKTTPAKTDAKAHDTSHDAPPEKSAAADITGEEVGPNTVTDISAAEAGENKSEQEEPEWVKYSRVNAEGTEGEEELEKP